MDPRELRILFAGRGNAFNRGIINWLSKRYCVVGALFLENNRHSFGGRLTRLRKRMRKHGVVAIFDELAFHLYDRLLHSKRNRALQMKAMPLDFFEKKEVLVPTFNVDDLHSPKWLATVRELKPDIVFSVCSSVIFQEDFYSIPPLGTFVLHEGITPEYRGLHTALWALLNRDHDCLGYTLLKVDNQIDGGEILVQGRYELEPGEDHTLWSCVGHKAIYRGLPDMELALNQLAENLGFAPVPQAGRRSGYYTWMRLSTYLMMIGSARNGGNGKAS